MSARGATARRAFLFALVPILTALASLLVIPAITGSYGADGWAAIAIGLSVGTGLSVVGELGWALDGPVRAARARGASAQTLFSLSLSTKIVMLPITATIAGTVAALVSQDHRGVAGAAGVAASFLGLSMTWFLIGQGKPGAILLSDALPKMVAAAAASLALSQGAPLIVYPVLYAAAAVSAPLLVARACRLSLRRHPRLTSRRVRTLISAQWTPLRGRLASTVYIALPTVLVGIVAPDAVAVFSAVDRLQRMVLTLLQPLPSMFLKWVASEPEATGRLRRGISALQMNAVLGVVAAAGWLLVAPVAARMFFGDAIPLPFELIAITSGIILTTVLSRITGGVVLVSLRLTRTVSDSALLGAVVGVIAILLLAGLLGAAGGLIGELAAELAVLGWQVVQLVRRRSQVS